MVACCVLFACVFVGRSLLVDSCMVLFVSRFLFRRSCLLSLDSFVSSIHIIVWSVLCVACVLLVVGCLLFVAWRVLCVVCCRLRVVRSLLCVVWCLLFHVSFFSFSCLLFGVWSFWCLMFVVGDV